MKDENQLFCNVCGKTLKMEQGILKEGVFEATKEWGYFSHKDLEVHYFQMCEDCYNQMISNFVIPVTIYEKKEI